VGTVRVSIRRSKKKGGGRIKGWGMLSRMFSLCGNLEERFAGVNKIFDV